jgi:hypothetical protein
MKTFFVFKINDKVRCVHKHKPFSDEPQAPEGSLEFQIDEFKQGDGVFLKDVDKVYACGPSLHSACRIVWPIDEIELIS